MNKLLQGVLLGVGGTLAVMLYMDAKKKSGRVKLGKPDMQDTTAPGREAIPSPKWANPKYFQDTFTTKDITDYMQNEGNQQAPSRQPLPTGDFDEFVEM